MKHDMSIIWDEIEALEEKNAALREQLKIIAEAKPIDLSSLSGLPGIGGLLGNSEWAQRQVERIFENFQNGMFEKINGELGDNIAVIEEYMASRFVLHSLF